MKTTALNFATNLFGKKLSPDIKQRLEAVIENPNQETWEDAHSIIVNGAGRTSTLWQAVLLVDPQYIRSKPLDAPWPSIPTSETIVKGIRAAVFQQNKVAKN